MASPTATARLLYQSRRSTIAGLLAGPPTATAQALLLFHLRDSLSPILQASRLPAPFTLKPGIRLRRRYGQCRRLPGSGLPPEVAVRCTQDGAPGEWRRLGSIAGTLLHELAHLRYAHHRPRFWACCRRLFDQAAEAGVYDPADEDPRERAQGDGKLAGSAAHAVAENARRARREASRTALHAMTAWEVGHEGDIRVARGPLAGARVRVVRKLRTRLEVVGPDGRRYLVPAALLQASAPTSGC